jgi:hypothetical protein
MQHQRFATVEAHENVLGAPCQPVDALAAQPLDEALGERRAQVGAALLDRRDAHAFHYRSEAAADGFDFRQFRHGWLYAVPGVWRKPLRWLFRASRPRFDLIRKCVYSTFMRDCV